MCKSTCRYVAVSSQIVTGPSLTRLTCISAPKRPVSTVSPSPRRASAKDTYSPSASAGGKAREKPGRVPRDVSAAACVSDGAVHLARLVLEDAQLGDFRGQGAAGRFIVAGHRADQDQQARTGPPNGLAVHVDMRLGDALQKRPHRKSAMSPGAARSVRKTFAGAASSA